MMFEKGMAKKTFMLVIFALFIILLAGCGTNNENSNSSDTLDGTTANNPAKISIALEGSDDVTAQETERVYKEVIAKYEEMTGHEIEFIFVPEKDYRVWTVTQQAAENLPDITSTRLAWAWEDYAKGQIIEMGSFLEKNTPYNENTIWKDTFVPSLVEQSIDPAAKNFSTVLREVLMVRIIYNKEIFEEAGITKVPETWEEFIAASEKIRDSGFIPFSAGLVDGPHASWVGTSIFGQLDSQLREKMDEDGDGFVAKNELAKATDNGLIDFSKGIFKDGFELLKEFSTYWNSDFTSADSQYAQQLWLTGQAAMTTALSHDLNIYDGMEGRDFEYGAFPLPLITKETHPSASGKVTMLGGAANESWAISTKTKGDELDASVDFLMYLTSPEVQGKFATELYKIPVIQNATLPEKIKGFTISPIEDIRRANYTGPVTSNEFATYFNLATPLYLSDQLDYDKFSESLNAEWKKGMENGKTANNWTVENNYMISE